MPETMTNIYQEATILEIEHICSYFCLRTDETHMYADPPVAHVTA